MDFWILAIVASISLAAGWFLHELAEVWVLAREHKRFLRRRYRGVSAIALACVALALPAAAAPDPAQVVLLTGAVASLTEEDASVTPLALLEVDAPVPIAGITPLRFRGRLGISSQPGEDLSIEQPETFRAAAAALAVAYPIGRMQITESGQTLTTSVVVEWGWSSALHRVDQEPDPRLARHYGLGLLLEEKVSGASVQVLYGRAEIAGDRGWGQWLARARVPIPGSSQFAQIVAEAMLNVGPSRGDIKQRDLWRVGVAFDAARIVKKLAP